MSGGKMIDLMNAALCDNFRDYYMGIAAENLATKYKISKEEQDGLAAESHKRTSTAIDNSYFKDRIVLVEIKSHEKTTYFDTDEHVRHDVMHRGDGKTSSDF